ncbi:MAG: ABC transporter ATP-binding protein [Planctomycetota bacterium]|nr:ABC transporter ATP-binding protein [Planctomycetaceae bacterium]MDQ3330903.1 ABC transporter ATP-binding protein [Planctomycetota bacterium]
MSEAIVHVSDLRKTYSEGLVFRRRVEALRGVSLAVQPGEIFGLLGPNGAGKTTLIKVLLGIVRKSEGDARLFDRPAGDRAARRRVGYLPESHRLPRHLTANTALDYYGGLSDVPAAEIRRRRPHLLRLVGLEKWGKTSVAKFSKGMQQRLGLAQAMLHDPDLLVLDEPTDGVDPVGRADIRRVLRQLKERGKTVFLNSHLLQELELVCDRVAILQNGRVERIGTLDEVKQLAAGGRLEVAMQLEGELSAIEQALAGLDVRKKDAVDSRRVQIVVGAADQAAVDTAVDAVRRAGVSVCGLIRRQRTLEEAFLEIVGEEERA